jgi:hypothetical protein
MRRVSAPIAAPTSAPPESTDRPAERSAAGLPASRATVVWIDGRRATVAHWVGHPIVATFEADVPSRHRSTGHIRHDPSIRHGGGGVPDDRIARDRAGHVARHLDRVVDAIPTSGPVLVLGPAELGEKLAARLRAADRQAHRVRPIDIEHSGPLTERQLVARLRALGGSPPKRRIVSDH